MAAGDGAASHHHDRIGFHVEAEFLAQFGQADGCTLGFVAEVEILAFMHFFCPEAASQDVTREISGCSHGEIACKGNHQERIQAAFAKKSLLAAWRSDQLGSNVWPQNAQRMRLEGYGDRPAAGLMRASDHFFHDLLMSAMHAVKITHADDGGSKIVRDLFNRSEDSHAMSNSSFRPSCARRT